MTAAAISLANDPVALAALIDRVIKNQNNRIEGRDALLLRNAVDDLRAAGCAHQNIEVYTFAADRFSGTCRDCGADVRSGA